jgi:hypothetical protein
MTQICALKKACRLQQVLPRAAAFLVPATRIFVPKSVSMVSRWTPQAAQHVNVTIPVQDFRAAPLNSALLSKMRTVQASCAPHLRSVRAQVFSLTARITQLLEMLTATTFVEKHLGH